MEKPGDWEALIFTFSYLTLKDLESAYIHPNFMPHETALFKQDAGVDYVKFTDLETQQKLCEIMETSCIGRFTDKPRKSRELCLKVQWYVCPVRVLPGYLIATILNIKAGHISSQTILISWLRTLAYDGRLWV